VVKYFNTPEKRHGKLGCYLFTYVLKDKLKYIVIEGLFGFFRLSALFKQEFPSNNSHLNMRKLEFYVEIDYRPVHIVQPTRVYFKQ